MLHLSKNGIVLKNGFFFYAELETKAMQMCKVCDGVVWFLGDNETCTIMDLLTIEQANIILILQEAIYNHF